MQSTREFAELQNQIWDEAQQHLAAQLRALPLPSGPGTPDFRSELSHIIVSLKRVQDARYRNQRILQEIETTQHKPTTARPRKPSTTTGSLKELLHLLEAEDEAPNDVEAELDKWLAANPSRKSPGTLQTSQPPTGSSHPKPQHANPLIADQLPRAPIAESAKPQTPAPRAAPLIADRLSPTPVEKSSEPSPPVRRANPRIGRNDPCPCGSGKKYKRCCLARDQNSLREQSRAAPGRARP